MNRASDIMDMLDDMESKLPPPNASVAANRSDVFRPARVYRAIGAHASDEIVPPIVNIAVTTPN